MDTLIFSASIGAGHDQVSKALREEILRRDPTARVAIVDTISYISPFLNKLMLEGYLNMLRFTPRVWGRLYERTEEEASFDIGSLVTKVLAKALSKVIIEYNPQAIICTHAFSAGLIGTLKAQGRINTFICTVITDFAIHPFWIHEGVDLYCTAHESLAYILQELGVPTSMTCCSGIPIMSAFNEPVQRSVARAKHKLADKPTLLVMGGSLGLGDITTIVSQFDTKSLDTQVLVVCGRNELLRNQLAGRIWRNEFRFYGFINYVHELMAASNAVVTKPGGVTVAEALSLRLPLVLISPIPGQENRNCGFLTEQGAAVRFAEEKHAGVKLAQLLQDEERLAVLSKMAARLAKPQAATSVIDQIEQRLIDTRRSE